MDKSNLIYILGAAAGVFAVTLNGLISPLSKIDNIGMMCLSGIVIIGLFIYRTINKKKEKSNE